jgi:S-adenosylmethionine:tRNA ribosyltransferase-isomerase
MPAPDDSDRQPWEFNLPSSAIARYPAAERSASRLMHVPLDGTPLAHCVFTDLTQRLRPGDLLIGNNTRVMPARLRARRKTGGAIEILLLSPGPGPILALVRPLRKLKIGEVLEVEGGARATLLRRAEDGQVELELDTDPVEVMNRAGAMPLPPYLERESEALDRLRYQTVYAGPLGAAAAPTAGLHFTDSLLNALDGHGVGFETLTLHVGIGTFRPLRPEDIARGTLHPEHYEISPETVSAIRETRARGGRIIAIGTTSARALESATGDSGVPVPGPGTTRLFIQPPYAFRAIDGLITNFHLPRSSLLMLVGSLIGRKRLMDAYGTAVETGYRFYSYGDAMLLL